MKLAEKTLDETVKNLKMAKSPNFAQNQLFVTFSIFVSEIQRKTLM